MIQRRKAFVEIKLLRLGLIAKPNSPCEEIDDHWLHAQPALNLSPEKAAASLAVDVWSYQSTIKKRYQTLQVRYPSDQFMEKHIEWGPAAELLGNPIMRLNWYWQSGLIPDFKPSMDCTTALARLDSYLE
jgi:hypothetical protein